MIPKVLLWMMASYLIITPTSTSKITEDLINRRSELTKKYGEAIEAIFGIGIRSAALLADSSSDGNLMVSPVSITLLLGQLMIGAEGTFREQLYNLFRLTKTPYTEYFQNLQTKVRYQLPYASLHLQLRNLLKELGNNTRAPRNFTLHESNALFFDKHIILKEQFARYLQIFYETNIQPLDFDGDPEGSLKIVNKWAETQTNGLIKTVLPNAPKGPNAAIFANALYFNGEWEMPFSSELNSRGYFSVSKDKRVEVTYMVGFFEDIKYAETRKYKLICLPYKNEELGMYILLPNEGNESMYDIRHFQQNLLETDVIDTISKAHRRQVVVKIPKMQLSSTVSILSPLRKYVAFKKSNTTQPASAATNDTRQAALQVSDLVQDYIHFNATEKAQEDVRLSDAAINADLQISDIVQQLTLSVNEKGTEAAAVTAGIIDYIGGSKNFVVDRPFVFFIWQEETLVVLFWGSISDPTQSNSVA